MQFDLLVYLIALRSVCRMALMNLKLVLFFLHLGLPYDRRLRLRREAQLPKADCPAMCCCKRLTGRTIYKCVQQ